MLTAPERIPTTRERKFLPSRRGIKSEVKSRQNARQGFRLKKQKDNKQKSESINKSEPQNQQVQKQSSQTLKLVGNAKSRNKNIKNGFNDKPKKNRNKKSKILRKMEGGKVPLKRKRV